MRLLIAPNAFKNSLTAPDAADAIRLGLLQSGLRCSIRSFPIGDGGDGTGSLIVHHGGGMFHETQAKDPLGRKISTSIGFIDDGQTAVIEMADISGLKILQEEEKDPLHASSFGTGELIRIALDRGVRKIILGIGGSATVDGGCGILQALGAVFLDQAKKELTALPEKLVHLEAIDIAGIDTRIGNTELIVLCDVDNPLLGEKGAAAVFGPQKGASKEQVQVLEQGLQQLNKVSLLQTGKDMNAFRHGGAAGGAAAGLHIFLGAKLVQGIEYFLDITGFDEALMKTDLLITGEGKIDLQTLDGKGPFGVARRAKKNNIPVIGLAGEVPLHANTPLNSYFDILMAIGNQPEDKISAIQHTAANLRRTAREIGKLIRIGLG
jgi:glycerate 2-kinase